MQLPLVWTEISLKAVTHNVKALRQITNKNARLMAVVKANAYGHGILEVATHALNSGADSLGVARVDEAIELRNSGIKAPVLIFGYTPPELADTLLDHDLTQTVFTPDTAGALSEKAITKGKKIKVHLKIDTGMGRTGFIPENLSASGPAGTAENKTISDILSIAKLPGLEVEGIYTHFAAADHRDKTGTKKQFTLFMDFLDQLKQSGLEFPVRHAANSAAIIDMSETHLDMVRPGISLYGLYPSDEVKKENIVLAPAMTFKTRIIQIKKVPPGFSISYGMTFKTEKPSTIATVSVGYADGYNRLLSSAGSMIIRGQRAPVVGRVCMDQLMLDISHISEAETGDEAVIFGKQEDASISVDEVAARLNTISYEVVSLIPARVPRIYLK